MPGRLATLDDRWGVGWRVAMALRRARRARVRPTARFLAALVRGAQLERPVFIVGSPRSGTSTLFQLLRSSEELEGLPFEAHDVWRAFHHPRLSRWRSDAVGEGELRPGEKRFVRARFGAHVRSGRLVEKTPENSLRVPYLLGLFPDAIFVVVKRNPCDVISSLINGWRHPAGRYRSYFVPVDLQIEGYEHPRRWCFALIEGWRDLVASTVPEVAFAQWDACTRALEEARGRVRPPRWVEVHLEDLIEQPPQTLSKVCQGVGIACDARLVETLEALSREPANALSPPSREKWRRDNPREIGRLLPRIAAAAAERGYLIDRSTGDFELIRSGPRAD